MEMEDNGNELHGVDLSKWTYLGYTTMIFEKENKEGWVFFFAEKDNEEEGSRCWSVIGPTDLNFEFHPFIQLGVKLWVIGEYDLYQFIHVPSKWMYEYMADSGFAFNMKKKTWVLVGEDVDEKYERALREQRKPKKNNTIDTKILTFPKKDVKKNDDGSDNGQGVSEEQ